MRLKFTWNDEVAAALAIQLRAARGRDLALGVGGTGLRVPAGCQTGAACALRPWRHARPRTHGRPSVLLQLNSQDFSGNILLFPSTSALSSRLEIGINCLPNQPASTASGTPAACLVTVEMIVIGATTGVASGAVTGAATGATGAGAEAETTTPPTACPCSCATCHWMSGKLCSRQLHITTVCGSSLLTSTLLQAR